MYTFAKIPHIISIHSFISVGSKMEGKNQFLTPTEKIGTLFSEYHFFKIRYSPEVSPSAPITSFSTWVGTSGTSGQIVSLLHIDP